MADRLSSAKSGSSEPPTIKFGLPVLGQVLSFASNPYQLIKKLSESSIVLSRGIAK